MSSARVTGIATLLSSLALLATGAPASATTQRGASVEFRYDAPWAGGGARDPRLTDGRDSAARQEFPADAPCRWLPARRSGAGPTAEQARAASAAEAQAFRDRIASLESFFRSDPRFTAPLGVCLQFSNSGWLGGLEGGHALRGAFFIGAWPGEWLYRRSGRIVFDGETRHIVASVNTMPTDSTNSIEDATGAMIPADSRVLRPVGSHQGFAVHEGGLLVIARADRALFRPVSFERLARWVLAELAYREYESRTHPSERERATRAGVLRRDLNAALERLTPEERAAPGCFTGNELDFGDRLRLVVPAGDARCQTRMVAPDPDYFDRSLPRFAIQLVTLRSLPAQPPRGGLVGVPNGRAKVAWMNQALFWGVDWSAFRDVALAGH